MPIGPARMPLFDHLGELRMRVVRILVCVVIAVCVFYFAAPVISLFLLQPIADFIPKAEDGSLDLVFLAPLDPFTVRFKVAFWTSVIACSPVILWQILAFFLPALKPKERKWFVPTFIVAVVLFVIGLVFCYFIILPPAFEWLLGQAEGMGSIMAAAPEYVDIIIKFLIGFGFAFELPLIVFYLTIFEILPYTKLRASWRVVYIALLVISAIVTPDASPVTMGLMFAAMISLYEISLLVARLVLGSRIKEQKEELAAQAAEDAAWEEEWAQKKAERKAAREAEDEE